MTVRLTVKLLTCWCVHRVGSRGCSIFWSKNPENINVIEWLNLAPARGVKTDEYEFLQPADWSDWSEVSMTSPSKRLSSDESVLNYFVKLNGLKSGPGQRPGQGSPDEKRTYDSWELLVRLRDWSHWNLKMNRTMKDNQDSMVEVVLIFLFWLVLLLVLPNYEHILAWYLEQGLDLDFFGSILVLISSI